MTEHFKPTLISAIVLIFVPGLTNLFYIFRPVSINASVMPFAMPLICFGQYFYFLNRDFQKFCFTDHPDAKLAR